MVQDTNTKDTTRATGRIHNVAPFQEALHAVRNGEPVRILSIGDMEGKSPVYLAVNQNGTAEWNSITEFQITDPRALPLSPGQLQQFSQAQPRTK